MKRIPLLVLLFLQLASAQVAFEQANSLRFARFSEVMHIRMTSLAYEASEEQASAMLEHDLPLLAGSLKGINPKLLDKLETALQEVKDLAEKGSTRRLALVGRRVNGLLEQVQQTLIPAKTINNPVFRAALIVELLTLEEGVTEAYEEAVGGEDDAYLSAWVGLQRVKALWKPLKRKWASTEAVKKADEAFEVLDKIMPTSEPPERFTDPEDVERAVLDLSFAFEQGAGKPLSLQELPKSWELVYSRSNQACKAAEKGQKGLALEWILSANLYYQQYLTATLQTLEPDLHNQLSPILEKQLPSHIARGFGTKGECARLQGLLVRAMAILR